MGIGVAPESEVPVAAPRLGHARKRLDGGRQLRRVRVVGSDVNFQARLHALVAQTGPFQLPENGLSQDLAGIFFQHLFGASLFEPARIARVPAIEFRLPFVGGKSNFFGINDNDVVAHIFARVKGRLVFAAQDLSNLLGHSTDGLVLGIHQVPTALEELSWKRHCFAICGMALLYCWHSGSICLMVDADHFLIASSGVSYCSYKY